MKCILHKWCEYVPSEEFNSVADMYNKYPQFKHRNKYGFYNLYKDHPDLFTVDTNGKKIKHFKF